MKKPSLINKVLQTFGFKIVNIAASIERGWQQIGGAFRNLAKQKITNDSAMQIAAVFACIRAVSEDVAKMPFKVYQAEGDYKYAKPEHTLYNILQFRPNPEMTAQAFRETLTAHAIGWGNGYAEIERDIAGNILAIWPLRPDRVEVYRDSQGRLYYHVRNDKGGFIDLWPTEVLHIHGLGFNGIVGYNTIQYARETMGEAMAAQKMSGGFFGNGCHFGGNIKHPGNSSKEAQNRLKNQLIKENQGVDNVANILVLEEGMEFVKNVIDPKEAQFLETRLFSVTEICRWFRVPPHKIADLTKSAFSNIEQQNIDYVTDGLTGWCNRWEQEVWFKLFTPAEQRAGFYVKHIVAGLLRGDHKTRTEAYQNLFNMGAIQPNEIRELEEMNPIEGGNRSFIQLNLIPLELAGKVGLKNLESTQKDNNTSNNSTDAMINDIADRISAAEIREVEKYFSHKKFDREKFNARCKEFYTKHYLYICKAVSPLGDFDFSLDLLSMKNQLASAENPQEIFEANKSDHPQNVRMILKGLYYEK